MPINKTVLDSNPCIGILRNDLKSINMIKKAVKNDFEIIVPSHVLREVNKIVKNGKIRLIVWLLDQKAVNLSFPTDTKSVIETGEQLRNSYSFCHYPDNLILAQCKENDAVLLTRDRKLLQSADYAGIMACKPKDFGGFVSVS